MPCQCCHSRARCFTQQTSPASRNQLRCMTTRRQVGRCNHISVRAESKGFSPPDKPQQKAQQQKVSKRGTVASRPDANQRPPQRQQQQQKHQSKATQQPDELPRGQQDSEEVPEIVNDRILKRIIACSGIPVFIGFSLFPFFYFLKVTKHVDLPMSVVYIVQLLTFGGGFFGITYGILSASWDPMREGSLLGFTEFKANLPLILDRVKSRGGKGRV
ncbi:TPA: hypothetical protein ACH3X2_013008 [Trebouxia sp. C0005]